jgi:hypothetical protein
VAEEFVASFIGGSTVPVAQGWCLSSGNGQVAPRMDAERKSL